MQKVSQNLQESKCNGVLLSNVSSQPCNFTRKGFNPSVSHLSLGNFFRWLFCMEAVNSCLHCVNYCNFTWFPGLEILWKGVVSAEFRANHSKLCGSCAFPRNFHTRKLGEITAFYAVLGSFVWRLQKQCKSVFKTLPNTSNVFFGKIRHSL